MSRSVLEPAPPATRRDPSATGPLAVAGLFLALSAGPGIMVFGNSAAFSEIAGTPAHMACYGLALVGLLSLLVAAPRLALLPSGTGRPLPAGLLAAAVVATALNAATVYLQLFVVPDLARVNPEYLDEPAGGLLMVAMVGSWIAYLLAWTGVGVAALRRRAMPVPAAIVLILGAVLQVVIGPLAALPFGVALLLLARAASRGPLGSRGLTDAA